MLFLQKLFISTGCFPNCVKGVSWVLDGCSRFCQGCIVSASRMLQGYSRVVSRVLQGCCKRVSRVSQRCLKGELRVLKRMFQGCIKGFSRVYKFFLMDVCKFVSRLCPVSRVNQLCFKCVIRALLNRLCSN